MLDIRNGIKTALSAKNFMRKFCMESERCILLTQSYRDLSGSIRQDRGYFHYLIRCKGEYTDVVLRLRRKASEAEMRAALRMNSKDEDYSDIREIAGMVSELGINNMKAYFSGDRLKVSKSLTARSGFFTESELSGAAHEVIKYLLKVRSIINDATHTVVVNPTKDVLRMELLGEDDLGICEEESDDFEEKSECDSDDFQQDDTEDDDSPEDPYLDEELSKLSDALDEMFSFSDDPLRVDMPPSLLDSFSCGRIPKMSRTEEMIMRYFKNEISNNQ